MPPASAAPRSTNSAVYQASEPRGEAARGLPLSHTSTVSSPVTTSWAALTAPLATLNDLRKYRYAAGALTCGSPSGYQIQWAPDRLTGAAARACAAGLTTVDSAVRAASSAARLRAWGI